MHIYISHCSCHVHHILVSTIYRYNSLRGIFLRGDHTSVSRSSHFQIIAFSNCFIFISESFYHIKYSYDYPLHSTYSLHIFWWASFNSARLNMFDGSFDIIYLNLCWWILYLMSSIEILSHTFEYLTMYAFILLYLFNFSSL